MPNCFCLYRKADIDSKLELKAVPLNIVDAELCAYMHIEVHPTDYAFGWFDVIGLRLALGQSFIEQIANAEEHATEPNSDDTEYYIEQLKILRWLDANFTFDSWVER